ncbi:chromate efflux transporter [Acinetobacter sp. PK01]|uniref:chromate efflux transporter n=1 Tax=Acinetobacter sp. PK01 TaxID=2930198 RepID=UPI001FB74435|nr:chromate efflux transporter [Acinetobacter sp. PK01]UOG16865.1 chromate efflux transporter [Acinetobacter sp. PK01]
MEQELITPPEAEVLPISFWQAFLFWLKLGFISFGGPAGQIAVMHQELVEQKRWISEKRFLHALNYCMLLPGPEAQQLATYIGWLMHRTTGGLVAGILFVLPSLFILIGLSWVYVKFGDVPIIAGIFYGIKPAVVAIVFHATHRIGSRSLKNKFLWLIAALSFIAIFFLNLPFPLIVLSAAIIGYLTSKKYPSLFSGGNAHQQSKKDYGPALIDDDTPTPAHAIFSWKRLGRIILIGGLLWFLPILSLSLTLGWDHAYTQMAWFFTKAALLTFGGAYAVLPYVYQGAVNYYGWLSPTQMIDGLALGESTPGPLIMVVAFVGFLGGYNHALLGSEHLFLAGAIGATIVTWFTFLFSFIFILAGAPIIESTHNQIKFTAPLTAITAAVVGVILNLALFFAYHVLWPKGFNGQFDYIAAVITLLACVALFKFNQSVLRVIGAAAVLGLVIQLSL